jgi:hypothetical protein
MGKRSVVRDTVEGARKRSAEKGAGRDRSPRQALAAPPRRGRPPAIPPSKATARKSRASLKRHSRKCSVCKHPDREAIEHEFLRWRSPEDIAEEYGIADHSYIYRHVHATGIFARRRKSIRLALEPLLEHASTVKVTASAIISALRLYTQINEAGEWIRPAKTGIIHHFSDSSAPVSERNLSNPNRQFQESKHAPTH